MKIKNKLKTIVLICLLLLNTFLFPILTPITINTGKNDQKNAIDDETRTAQAGTLTDEFTSIFTWKSSIDKTYNYSYESLNLDSLVGNLTDFDPDNSTSYTNLDTINVNYQPSNTSWSHYRDFDNDVSLPSTNIAAVPTSAGEMFNPYDTTVFFARKDAVYNITASWEQDPTFPDTDFDANLFFFNQSQFHNFENHIKPWRAPITSTIAGFKSAHSSDDWLIEYSNTISGSGTLNHTKKFEDVTFNKTGWFYLVLWGPGYDVGDQPRVATSGILLSEGPANDNITTNDLMNMYRPSLGKIAGTITDPVKVYERVIQGVDETYGDSLVLIYIYEFLTRLNKDGLTTVDYDWMPYITYINNNSVGKFPNRIAYYYDDNWYDNKDRHLQIVDPNFSSGDGFYQYTINITAEFAPFMNETVTMNANVSTTPISMENRVGSAIRLSITANSHGCEVKPPHWTAGTTYTWTEIPKFALNGSTLRKLYNDTLIEYLEGGWQAWSILGLYYPEKTPFTLYFKSLFEAPYLVSGLETLLLVTPEAQTWIEDLIPTNTYFNSSLYIEVNTTIDIPVNFTITYPENEPAVGQSCDFTLALGAMGNPNITIDYEVNYSMDFSMMLFTGSYNTSNKDRIHFVIPLQEIDYILGIFGVEDGLSGLASRQFQKLIDKALESSKVGKYIAIENFLLGSHVVGNLVSCDIRVHLWPIIKDIIQKYKPEFYLACELIDRYVLHNETGLDLILSPQLQGVINGTIVGDGMNFNNGGLFEFNDTHKSITYHVDRTQDYALTSIQLQSLLYFLNFHIDWAFEINFQDLLHKFGLEDLRWELGTYPSVDFAHTPMNDSELVSLNWNEWTPPSTPTLSITTPSPTSSLDIALEWTISSSADNYTLYRHSSTINSSNLNSATLVKTVTGNSTTDTVSGLGRWFYAVIATNETGSSDPSNSPYIDVQSSPFAPDTPTLTILTSSPTISYDIALEWTASIGADNYTLYRHTSEITLINLNLATEIKTITGNSTTDTVSRIGRYYYAVVATNGSGSSKPSNSPFIDKQSPPSPNPPILTIATSSPTTSYDISLTWTTSTGADNYTLYRHTSAITSSNLNSATAVKTITGTSTTDTVSGIGRWYYAVVATNASGSSDPSNSPYIDVQSPPSAPNPPTLTITTSSPTTSHDISLTWTTSTGADNYTLYRHTSAITSSNLNSATTVKTITGTSTTDTVSGVGRWYYAVVATNEVGSSDPSNSPYIDVQDEPTDGAGGEIPGYPLIFLVLFSLTGIILIIHKKVQNK